MSENNDKHIEDLFKKASEEHQIGFEEKDWHAMEAMLEKEKDFLSGIFIRKTRRILLILGAFVFLTGIIYLISSDVDPEFKKMLKTEPKEQSVNKAVQKNMPERVLSQIKDSVIADYKILKEKQKIKEPEVDKHRAAPERTASQKQPIAQSAAKSSVNKPITEDKTDKRALTKTSADFNATEVEDLKDYSHLKTNQTKVTPEQKQIEGSFNKETVTNNEGNKISEHGEETPTIPSTITAKKTAASPASDSLVTENVPADTLTEYSFTGSGPILKEKIFVPSPFRWSVAFALGPDISKMGLNKYTDPGYSYGIAIYYHLSQKIHIGIGGYKSAKKYLGRGSDYHPPKGYWKYYTNGIVPDQVAGECTLLEVPITFQYRVVSAKKNNLYLAAGVSSYFLQSESYQYSFNEPNPEASQGWSLPDTKGNYLFNIINLSAGYERAMAQRFHLGLEPYVKIPVKGMGWSEVKFWSFGAFITFRYSLIRKDLRSQTESLDP